MLLDIINKLFYILCFNNIFISLLSFTSHIFISLIKLNIYYFIKIFNNKFLTKYVSISKITRKRRKSQINKD